MIIGLLGVLIFIGALVALAVNNINTPKNPKPVTPEEKRKRTERNLAIGAVGLGALWAGAYALERANRKGMPGWDLRPSGSSPVPCDPVQQECAASAGTAATGPAAGITAAGVLSGNDPATDPQRARLLPERRAMTSTNTFCMICSAPAMKMVGRVDPRRAVSVRRGSDKCSMALPGGPCQPHHFVVLEPHHRGSVRTPATVTGDHSVPAWVCSGQLGSGSLLFIATHPGHSQQTCGDACRTITMHNARRSKCIRGFGKRCAELNGSGPLDSCLRHREACWSQQTEFRPPEWELSKGARQ